MSVSSFGWGVNVSVLERCVVDRRSSRRGWFYTEVWFWCQSNFVSGHVSFMTCVSFFTVPGFIIQVVRGPPAHTFT